MHRLRLPMWFITERDPQGSPPNPPCGDSRATMAFSDTMKVLTYMASRQAGSWTIALVSDREGLIVIIADAHLEGVETICIDPELDGSGGEAIPLVDLIAID
jgi:hypothetical protein